MFASEHFLRNGLVSFMTKIDGAARWFTHPCILTYRALYFFTSINDYFANNYMRICLDDEQAYVLETDEIIPIDKRRGENSFYIALINHRTGVFFSWIQFI